MTNGLQTLHSRANNRCLHTGKAVNHQFAKELLAGFAGGEIDKLAETHGAGSTSLALMTSAKINLGMNEYDKLRAHHQAKEKSRDLFDQQYGNSDQYDPNAGGPPQQLYYNQNQGGY